MYFEGNFRHIGQADVEPLKQLVDQFGEPAWHEYVRRQQRFAPHRQTHTIPLLFDEDMRHDGPTPWPRLEQAQAAIEPFCELIRQDHVGTDGYFVRIILTRLIAGAVISPHRDRGGSIMRSHRYHVAVTTNPGVDFGIDGEIRHFAPGEVWEINNRRYHAVRNVGSEPRVHLILDYVVRGEMPAEPEHMRDVA